MAGFGHEGQGRIEDVEVTPEVHVEQRDPIFLGPAGEVTLPGDAGDVHHRMEAAVLVGELLEERGYRFRVGHRGGRGASRTAGSDDASRRGIFRLGQLLGAVEGDERVEGDDVPAAAAERLRDGGADPARAPGDDGDAMTWAHGVVGMADGDSRSSSRPSKQPSSSHLSRSSR